MGINKMDSQKLVVKLEMDESTLRLMKQTIIELIHQMFDYLHEVFIDISDDERTSIEEKIDALYLLDEQLSDAMEEYDLDL